MNAGRDRKQAANRPATSIWHVEVGIYIYIYTAP